MGSGMITASRTDGYQTSASTGRTTLVKEPVSKSRLQRLKRNMRPMSELKSIIRQEGAPRFCQSSEEVESRGSISFGPSLHYR